MHVKSVLGGVVLTDATRGCEYNKACQSHLLSSTCQESLVSGDCQCPARVGILNGLGKKVCRKNKKKV